MAVTLRVDREYEAQGVRQRTNSDAHVNSARDRFYVVLDGCLSFFLFAFLDFPFEVCCLSFNGDY